MILLIRKENKKKVEDREDERIMREAGRGDELDEINRPIIREHDSE